MGHQAEDTDLYKVDYREDFVDLGCWSRLHRSPSPRGDNGIALQVDKPSTLLSHKWQTLNAKPLALLKAWSFRCGRRGFVPLLSALEGGSARVSVCLRIITHTQNLRVRLSQQSFLEVDLRVSLSVLELKTPRGHAHDRAHALA